MKAREIRELAADELEAKIRVTRKELAGMKLRQKSGAEVEKPVKMRSLRRDSARMLTVQNAARKEAK